MVKPIWAFAVFFGKPNTSGYFPLFSPHVPCHSHMGNLAGSRTYQGGSQPMAVVLDLSSVQKLSPR